MKNNLLTIGLVSSLLMPAFGFDIARAMPLLAGRQSVLPVQADVIQIGERNDFKPLAPGTKAPHRSADTATNAIVTNLVAAYEKAAGSSNMG